MIASTVEAEVSFGPINMGLSEEEVKHRVDSSMMEMNIELLRERPVHYLSGGQKACKYCRYSCYATGNNYL